MQVKVIDDAAPAAPDHTFTVRIVHHRDDVILFAHCVQLVERRDVAVHRKHAVGDEHRAAIIADILLDDALGIRHIAMFIDDNFRRRQTTPVDDARVIQAVGKNHILFADHRRNRGLICAKTGLHVQRIFHSFERRHSFFKFAMQFQCPGDTPHRGGTDTPFCDGALRGSFQAIIIRKSQIIVRAKVEHRFAIDDHPRAARRANGADCVEETLLLEVIQFV